LLVRLGYHWYQLESVLRKSPDQRARVVAQWDLVSRACAVPPLAYLISHLLHAWTILGAPASPQQAWGGLDAEEEAQLQANLRASGYGQGPSQAFQEALGVLVRCAKHSGSDIRAADGILLSPRSWPRRGLNSENYVWKIVLAVPFARQHINLLEMNAILLAFRWRLRRVDTIGARIIHTSDSQVCIAILCKGRTSARRLLCCAKKVSATVVAASLHPYFVFVESARNPADEPSRKRKHGA